MQSRGIKRKFFIVAHYKSFTIAVNSVFISSVFLLFESKQKKDSTFHCCLYTISTSSTSDYFQRISNQISILLKKNLDILFLDIVAWFSNKIFQKVWIKILECNHLYFCQNEKKNFISVAIRKNAACRDFKKIYVYVN